MWTCREMKRSGWDKLSGSLWTAVLLTFIFIVISGILPMAQSAISMFRLFIQRSALSISGNADSGYTLFGNNSVTNNSQMLVTSSLSSLISMLSLLATFLLINPITVGYARWFLTNRTPGSTPSISLLFSSFKSESYSGSIAGMAWKTLWTMIWGFVAGLFLIPFFVMITVFIILAVSASWVSAAHASGYDASNYSLNTQEFYRRLLEISPVILIVALLLLIVGLAGYFTIILNRKYAYMFTEFILAENPKIGAQNALNLSKKMSGGMKGKLFLLDLSFIGWWLLSMLTFGLLSLGIKPYVYATYAEVYEKRKVELDIVLG